MTWKHILGTMLGVMVLGASNPALAANDRTESYMGLYVSNLAGSGLTFGQRHPSGFGYHVSGIGFAQDGRGWMNVGGAITKDLITRDWGTMYGLVACGLGVGSAPLNMPQGFNLSPGIGFDWGDAFVELGMSFSPSTRNVGVIDFLPGLGGGVKFRF